MNIKDFNAYKFANDIKKKYGQQACNNFRKCMYELRKQSENSSLFSELDNPTKKLIRIAAAPNGTPTLLVCTTDNMNIYAYSVHNYSWAKELIADIKDYKAWRSSNII